MSRIKIPEVGKWVRNVLYSMPNNRAEEFKAPPDVSGGAFFETPPPEFKDGMFIPYPPTGARTLDSDKRLSQSWRVYGRSPVCIRT